MNERKTIVILGPTASGKTGISIELGKAISGAFTERSLSGCGLPSGHSPKETLRKDALKSPYQGAEIISADSRAIYRGMELGTAAPSFEEQAGIPHWGIGIVDPGERFTVADWKEYAEEKIREIRERGNLPMVVGGTGLYIDALIYDYKFGEHEKNSQCDRAEMCSQFLTIGVKTDAEVLRERITERADKLFVQELFEETRNLVERYGWGSQAMKSNIYQFAWGYLQGEYSLEKAKELFIYDDWHLAKRQMTWFKRNKNIIWLPLEEIRGFVLKCIQDEQRK
jgi:tRNA dimethylallyltransferase